MNIYYSRPKIYSKNLFAVWQTWKCI